MTLLEVVILIIALVCIAGIEYIDRKMYKTSRHDLFYQKCVIIDKKDKNYSMTGRVLWSYMGFGKEYYEIKLITGEHISIKAIKVKIYE